MAGLQGGAPTPQALTVHNQSRVLEIVFSDGAAFRLPFELLRIYSPSAEVQGHGPGQEVLQTGKREVELTALEPVGNYAVQPSFSDGHESGIYSWEYLYFLGAQQDALWKQYEERLAEAGEANLSAIAPGVASALACTLFGLLVAIPALFAYTFLGVQIKHLNNETHHFIEEYTLKVEGFHGEEA